MRIKDSEETGLNLHLRKTTVAETRSELGQWALSSTKVVTLRVTKVKVRPDVILAKGPEEGESWTCLTAS